MRGSFGMLEKKSRTTTTTKKMDSIALASHILHVLLILEFSLSTHSSNWCFIVSLSGTFIVADVVR